MDRHKTMRILLPAFTSGELAPERRAQVEAHLAKCERCRSEVGRLRSLLAFAGQIAAQSIDEQTHESAKQKVYAVLNREKDKYGVNRAKVRPNYIWRTIMNTRKLKFAAAAIIILGVLTGSFFLGGHGTGAAFGKVIESVTNAGSVRFTMRQKMGEQPAFVSKVYVHGMKMRLDMIGGEGEQEGLKKLRSEMERLNLTAFMSTTVDFATQEVLDVDHFRKTYKKRGLDNQAAAAFASTNLIEQFRKIRSEDARWLRDESQDGRKIDVYLVTHVNLMGIKADLSGGEGERMTVWVDRETDLPVRILLEMSTNREGTSRDWFEFCDFLWNESFDPALFSLEIPEGYYSADAVGRPDDSSVETGDIP